MKVVEYLVNELIRNDVTDVFGIPGTVLFSFIYSAEESRRITLHLNYHEQMSAYAACGYAHASGKLGVCYATKGPGITNMMTPIVEAYVDSLPVLFITAHADKIINKDVRIGAEQEIDPTIMVESVTKYAKRIDSAEEVLKVINFALRTALIGRKGPVLLDFLTSVLTSDMVEDTAFFFDQEKISKPYNDIKKLDNFAHHVAEAVVHSRRPIFLVGDGLRHGNCRNLLKIIAEKSRIPILSSRYSQDLFSDSSMYYGYIGSHGLRYSNFILSKTDYIIAMGNRLSFPIKSSSFKSVIDGTRIIWVDIDEKELLRNIPNIEKFNCDASKILIRLNEYNLTYNDSSKWISVCSELKERLEKTDISLSVKIISSLIDKMSHDLAIVCDIGNNELIASRAYGLSGKGQPILHSKSYKTVGSAIGKAIGAYYSLNKPVLCIMGDEGFQFNIQELQYISSNRIPIAILICNNRAAGMIRDSENRCGYAHTLQANESCGYSVPIISNIASAYGIQYKELSIYNVADAWVPDAFPIIMEIKIKRTDEAFHFLPKGNPCQKFFPEIEANEYSRLDSL